MREEGGFFWPDSDLHCSQAALFESVLIDQWPFKGFRECVQAGGNVGVYPKVLARKFERVYTFEPDGENFACLLENQMPENVVAQQAALMDTNRPVRLYRYPDNAGAHYVVAEGFIPSVRIDDLCLEHCDLIQLDVEGAELLALKGGTATIDRCHPVIVVEVKNHGQRFGYDKYHLYQWLAKRGYRHAATFHRDEAWTWHSSG